MPDDFRRALPELRRATAADAPAIIDLRLALTRWMHASGIDQWREGDLAPDAVATQCDAGEWHVGEVDGAVVATIRLAWSDPDFWRDDDAPAGYVHGVMVDRAYAGLGWGRALVDHAVRLARDAGYDRVRLDTAAHSATLVGFYTSMGFTVVREADLPASFGREMRIVLLERLLTLGAASDADVEPQGRVPGDGGQPEAGQDQPG